jgi:hypothetical protein
MKPEGIPGPPVSAHIHAYLFSKLHSECQSRAPVGHRRSVGARQQDVLVAWNNFSSRPK